MLEKVKTFAVENGTTLKIAGAVVGAVIIGAAVLFVIKNTSPTFVEEVFDVPMNLSATSTTGS